MNARDEFYITLSEDLTRNGEQSVLYRFLEEEQEKKSVREAGTDISGARSCQFRIRCYRNMLKAGAISPEEYLKDFCSVLLQKTKYCKRCGKPEKSLESKKRIGYHSRDPEPLLKELLDAALGIKPPGRGDNPIQDLKRLSGILNEGKGSEYRAAIEGLQKGDFLDESFDRIMTLTDAVLDVAIAYDIKEFFFGTAVETLEDYKVSKRQRNPDQGQPGGRPERSDKSLRLIDYYCRREGTALFGAAKKDAPGDVECDLLYRKLLAGGNESVFVPLLVDTATGCGIYIVGKKYFEGDYEKEKEHYRRIRESCTYGVMLFDDDSGENIRTGYHFANKYNEFSNYNEARFSGDWSYESVRQLTADMIKEANGKMSGDIPVIFRKYFEADAELEEEVYRREIREDVSNCEQELRTGIKKKQSLKN